ncbi:hypothetical protein KI688_007227 [Linnemannia hyalina]|uniref:Uncharacterized protein n=1 Tax=Linnemannia hyalina TaxID=64524 RepID=A0A9P8BNB5_9FUNG|nr:hypothetical protein KI688_007227 [Linnemannia hyalina]
MKNGVSVCMDFFHCTLPKSQQDTKHMTIYHDPRPIEIANLLDGGKPIMIHRDPRRKMFFPCPHPECDHSSILRSGPYQHQRHCKYIKRDLQRAAKSKSSRPSSSAPSLGSSSSTAVATTAVTSQSVRAKRRILNQTNVSRGRVGRPSSSSVRAASSVRSASTSSASSGSIFDHTPPPVTSPTPSPTPSPPPPPLASNDTTPNAALTQLLTGMQQLADTVNRFNKRLNIQTQTIGKMNEQLEWLADRVDEIRAQNASLDAHTESLRNDMDLVQDHLGDMLQDNQNMKGHLRRAREDVEQFSLSFQDRGHQDIFYS